MAIVKKRGKLLYIQWYDTLIKKVQSKSTGLVATEANKKKAKVYAKKLQEELTKKTQMMKQLGIQNITIKDAFEHFLKNNQNKNPKTIKDYLRFYKKFTEYFNEDKPCATINKLNVEDWLLGIKKLKLSKNSIHAYGKQLVHFLNFLFEYNYAQMFKINREIKTKPEIKEKIVLSDEDIHKIFTNLESKNENFNVCIYLLFYTGLRSSDLLTITGDRIDIPNRIIKYYSPKAKKFREIAFHEDLVSVLKSRVEHVGSEKIITYKSDQGISKEVKKYINKLNLLNKGYTPRTFRKTFITLCRSRYNMDASIVRELVGHAHGNTMDRFYNKIELTQMKEELKKFSRPQISDKS